MKENEPLLRVKDLTVRVHDAERGEGLLNDGVSFKLNGGEILGLAGESGSGKTTAALSILRLIGNAATKTPDPQRKVSRSGSVVSQREIIGGRIIFRGKDLLSLPEEGMRSLRGREISMIFQNPIASMHPLMIVGYQIGEPKETHERLRWERITRIVFDYLGKVKLPDAKIRAYNDPHTFSGGEGQRIMIAMALICNPSLLIADEPTKSLDLTIQRQVMELLKKLKKELDLSVLYISHDLGVIFEMSDHVAIMYAGSIVEYGDALTIYRKPRHPYTIGLKDAYPDLHAPKKRLRGIPGSHPTPFERFAGCKFYPRCEYAKPSCNEDKPHLTEIEPGHSVSCLRAHEIQTA
jgi:oligopeptide/dipeptide ABC transporter ATP-binding protein